MDCSGVTRGMQLRFIVSCLLLFMTYVMRVSFGKYMFVFLAILLTYVDGLDGTYIHKEKCHKSFLYHSQDKICDLMTYAFLYVLFPNDKNVLYLILYRVVGVILFISKRDATWLIPFFDFVKEYLVYVTFFPPTLRDPKVWGLMVTKAVFENYHHRVKYNHKGKYK